MEQNKPWKTIITYILVFLLFTFVFVLFFHTTLFIGQEVLFYRGLGLLVITTIITCIIATLLNHYWLKLQLESLIAAFIISISIHLSLFVVFPVTFDRSVTMYLLSTLKEKSTNQICSGLSERDLEQYFIDEYVKDKRAIRRRINEQSIIHILKEEDNCVQLTQKGQTFLNLSGVIKKIYAIK